MKNLSQPIRTQSVPAAAGISTSLYELVRKLQASLLPQTTVRKSFIINDVNKSVNVPAEENALAYIIGNLLSHAVYRTTECCIRVETEFIAGQHQVRIRNNGAFAYSSYMHSLVHFVDVARKLGGNIGLETEENSGVTVIYSLARNAA
ncbi:MAG: sensor histidine kinase [Chitinophagaceae bacterium]